MLTARSTATSPLDVIRLTLEMLSGGRAVPVSLREHFDVVLRSARTLTRDPLNPPGDLSPEAIHLAFELISKDSLRAEFQDVNELTDVDPTRAGRLLAEMEQAPVHS